MYSKAIFWFRRDLRLDDNTALNEAFKHSKEIYPVFIFDKNILDKLSKPEDKRITIIWQALQEIKAKLNSVGSDLIIVYGNPVELIPLLTDLIDAQAVFTNRDYEGYALHRDETVQAKLNEKDRHFLTSKDHLIFESSEVLKPDQKPYTVFTPFKKKWLEALTGKESIYLNNFDNQKYLNLSHLANNHKISNVRIQLERNNIIQLAHDEDLKLINFHLSKLDIIINASFAHQRLKDFINLNIKKYKIQRDFPDLNSNSGLSIDLRFGTISIRECVLAAWRLLEQTTDLNEAENISCWLSELIWREFYSMILQSFPYVEKQAFREAYQKLNWQKDQKLLSAWQEGLTGYPIVDAGMRQLKQTGQLHNRLRMICASFLTKDLLIDWKLGEAHFANYLLDFDLASNNGGWQWTASVGTDASPYFRIFNPILQSQKFDPEAKYIKKWLPELKDIEATKIHKLDFQLNNYPKPIVKHEEVKPKVLQLFKT